MIVVVVAANRSVVVVADLLLLAVLGAIVWLCLAAATGALEHVRAVLFVVVVSAVDPCICCQLSALRICSRIDERVNSTFPETEGG